MYESKGITRFLLLSNLASWAALGSLVLAGWAPAGETATHRVARLETERLDIVGANGRPVMVLSNKANLPGPRLGDVEYPADLAPPRPHVAGMIFYNDAGDEVGGLVYNGMKLDSGYTAIGHLSLDQWKQNQVVALQYIDNGRTLRSGLRVWDRPTDVPVSRQFDRALAFRDASPAERDSLRRISRAARERGDFGSERLFIGSQDRMAKLELRDPEGRVRARLLVDTDGAPRLEFLDAAGRTVASYPER